MDKPNANNPDHRETHVGSFSDHREMDAATLTELREDAVTPLDDEAGPHDDDTSPLARPTASTSVQPSHGWVPAAQTTSWDLVPVGVWLPDDSLDALSALDARIGEWTARLDDLEQAFESALNTMMRDAWTAHLPRVCRLLERVFREQEAFRETMTTEASKAACELAAVLTRGALAQDASLARRSLDELLAFRPHAPSRVRVAPAVAAALSDVPTVVADSTLEPGDFVLEYEGGSLDCRVEALLERFAPEVQRHLTAVRADLERSHCSYERARAELRGATSAPSRDRSCDETARLP